MRISDWSSDVCSSDLWRSARLRSRAAERAMAEDTNELVMPKLGLTMAEGLLAEWRVAEGDVVSAGDVLFIVATAKIANRSEERRVGKECVSTCRSRWSPYH